MTSHSHTHALKRAIVALLAAAALVTVYLLLAPGGHTPRIGDASAAAPSGSSAASADASYSVLSRPAIANDDISTWKAATALGGRSGPGVNSTLNFSNARLIYQDDTRAVAAVPTSTEPCLATQFNDGSGALTCSPTLTYGTSIGLVPDSVMSVTFTLTDGTETARKVTDNFWRSPAEAAKVGYVLNGQTPSLELMPMSSLPKGAQISPSGVVSGGAAVGE
jgi:hypothetical protein